MKYGFIAQHQQEYPVTTMCQVLDVSVSGYYAWKQRPASARQMADERLSARMHQVHEATHQIYGSRRMRAELAEQGSSCGRKRVLRLMRQLGLQARRGRHRTGSQQPVGDGYHWGVDGGGLAVRGCCPRSVLAPGGRLGDGHASGCGVG